MNKAKITLTKPNNLSNNKKKRRKRIKKTRKANSIKMVKGPEPMDVWNFSMKIRTTDLWSLKRTRIHVRYLCTMTIYRRLVYLRKWLNRAKKVDSRLYYRLWWWSTMGSITSLKRLLIYKGWKKCLRKSRAIRKIIIIGIVKLVLLYSNNLVVIILMVVVIYSWTCNNNM